MSYARPTAEVKQMRARRDALTLRSSARMFAPALELIRHQLCWIRRGARYTSMVREARESLDTLEHAMDVAEGKAPTPKTPVEDVFDHLDPARLPSRADVVHGREVARSVRAQAFAPTPLRSRAISPSMESVVSMRDVDVLAALVRGGAGEAANDLTEFLLAERVAVGRRRSHALPRRSR
jgi:hypothetical protein